MKQSQPGSMAEATAKPLAASAAKATSLAPLVNGSFEEWKNGMPTGWHASQRVDGEWSKVNPKKVSGAEGGAAMQLPSISDGTTVVSSSQDVNGKTFLPDMHTRLSALCRATKGKQLQILFSYEKDGKVEKCSVSHSGSGEWEKVTKWFTLPAGFDESSCRVLIWRSPGQPGTVEVDDVSLWQVK